MSRGAELSDAGCMTAFGDPGESNGRPWDNDGVTTEDMASEVELPH
jgi:hypothetical protein